MKRDIAILGIYLGSQLITAANGAAVYPSKADQIGWRKVNTTKAGKVDQLIGNFQAQDSAFQ